VTTRVHVASDVHASEKCWLRLINILKFYSAQVVIIGGNITAKPLVPIVHRNGGVVARLMGIERCAESAPELKRLTASIANAPGGVAKGSMEKVSRRLGDGTFA
jgi:Icc-related predicted phosphoesterase